MTTRIIRAPIPSTQHVDTHAESSTSKRPVASAPSGNTVSQNTTILPERSGFEAHSGRDALLNEGTSAPSSDSSRSGMYRELQKKSLSGTLSQSEQPSKGADIRARGQQTLLLLGGAKNVVLADGTQGTKGKEAKQVGTSPTEQKIFAKKKSVHLAKSKKLAKQALLRSKKQEKSPSASRETSVSSESSKKLAGSPTSASITTTPKPAPSTHTATSASSGVAVATTHTAHAQQGSQATAFVGANKTLQPGAVPGMTASAMMGQSTAHTGGLGQSAASASLTNMANTPTGTTGQTANSTNTTGTLAQQPTMAQMTGDILGKSTMSAQSPATATLSSKAMSAHPETAVNAEHATASMAAMPSAKETGRSFSLQSLLLQEAKDTGEIKSSEDNKDTQSPRQEFRHLVKQWANAKEMTFLFHLQATVMPNDVSALAWKIATLAQQGVLPKTELMALVSKMLKTPGNRKKMDRIKNLLVKKGMVAAGASAESLELIAAMIAMYLAKKGDIEADDLIEELFGLPSRNLDLIVPDEGGSFHEEGREEQNHQEHQDGLKFDKFKT